MKYKICIIPSSPGLPLFGTLLLLLELLLLSAIDNGFIEFNSSSS